MTSESLYNILVLINPWIVVLLIDFVLLLVSFKEVRERAKVCQTKNSDQYGTQIDILGGTIPRTSLTNSEENHT